MNVNDVAQLHQDVAAIIQPISTYVGGPERDELMRLTHLLTVEELLVSLHLMASKMHPSVFDGIVRPIVQLEQQLKDIQHQTQVEDNAEPSAGTQGWIRTPAGRWKLHFAEDLLVELVELGFSDKDCALFLGCSERTIRRRRKELNIHKWNDQDVTDDQLIALNGALDHFASMWNNHKMRTPGLGNFSPSQLFFQGTWDATRRGYDVGFLDEAEKLALQEAHHGIEDWQDYGTEGDDGHRPSSEQNQVHLDKLSERVPPILNAGSTHDALRSLLPVEPFPPPSDFGLAAYLAVLDAINDLLE
ncbi:hypothetical protein OC835_007501 [Tilletia horrida]|nr:hypothetical protein OC835_007501 [Tilletia horrida]